MRTKVKHVMGARAVGGGQWCFNFCGGKNRKFRSSVFVTPAFTNCRKCQERCKKIYGADMYAESAEQAREQDAGREKETKPKEKE